MSISVRIRIRVSKLDAKCLGHIYLRRRREIEVESIDTKRILQTISKCDVNDDPNRS